MLFTRSKLTPKPLTLDEPEASLPLGKPVLCPCESVLVLAAASNKSATRPPLPPPACGGEWKETGRKLVGRDKGSLTEQQTKGTGTTMIQIRRNQDTNRTTHRAILPDRTAARAPELQVSSCRPAPPTRT